VHTYFVVALGRRILESDGQDITELRDIAVRDFFATWVWASPDFSLKKNRVKRYRHAARHFAECTSLASAIGAFGAVETHERYSNRLKQEHGRKTSFWTLVS
jgi:hypothetical protein